LAEALQGSAGPAAALGSPLHVAASPQISPTSLLLTSQDLDTRSINSTAVLLLPPAVRVTKQTRPPSPSSAPPGTGVAAAPPDTAGCCCCNPGASGLLLPVAVPLVLVLMHAVGAAAAAALCCTGPGISTAAPVAASGMGSPAACSSAVVINMPVKLPDIATARCCGCRCCSCFCAVLLCQMLPLLLFQLQKHDLCH
jgi:hypothetical protein